MSALLQAIKILKNRGYHEEAEILLRASAAPSQAVEPRKCPPHSEGGLRHEYIYCHCEMAPAPQSCEHDKPGAWERKEGGCLTNFSKKVSPNCPFCAPKASSEHDLKPVYNQSDIDIYECRSCEIQAHKKYFEAHPKCEDPSLRPVPKAQADGELPLGVIAEFFLPAIPQCACRGSLTEPSPECTCGSEEQFDFNQKAKPLIISALEGYAKRFTPTQPSPKAPQEREAEIIAIIDKIEADEPLHEWAVEDQAFNSACHKIKEAIRSLTRKERES